MGSYWLYWSYCQYCGPTWRMDETRNESKSWFKTRIRATISDTSEAQGLPKWAGEYHGETRHGGPQGIWGNAGNNSLIVDSSGDVSVDGAKINLPVFDERTSSLSWELSGGNI